MRSSPADHVRVAALRQFWASDASFSDRSIDLNKPTIAETTRQVMALHERGFRRLLEIGSGSGRYLAHLIAKAEWAEAIGSDIPSPRLDRARIEHPGIQFLAADALEAVSLARSGTLVVAVNVLGNLEPSEVRDFFARIPSGAALAFCAAGLSVDRSDAFERRPMGYNFNFTDLLRDSGLEVQHLSIAYDDNPERRARWNVAAIAP